MNNAKEAFLIYLISNGMLSTFLKFKSNYGTVCPIYKKEDNTWTSAYWNEGIRVINWLIKSGIDSEEAREYWKIIVEKTLQDFQEKEEFINEEK